MPGPSRTCAFGASSKAAHYSFKISLLLKIFSTALSKNPRSVLLVSKVAFGKNPFNRIKLQTENDLWSLHRHQALQSIIQPEKDKQKNCLHCPVYLKDLKLKLKVKAQQYFKSSFYMFEKKKLGRCFSLAWLLVFMTSHLRRMSVVWMVCLHPDKTVSPGA